MTGGSLILNSDEKDITFNPNASSSTACTGAALAITARSKDDKHGERCGSYWGEVEVSISGGEITGNHTIFEGLSEAGSTEASIKKFEVTGGRFTGTVLLDDELKEKIQDGTYNGISGGYFSEEVNKDYIKPGYELPKEEEVKDPTQDKTQDKNEDKGNGSNWSYIAGSEDSDEGDLGIIPDPDAGEWKKDAVGWWFQRTDGSYPKNEWKKLYYNGVYRWYHFGANGYMETGWFTDLDGNVYYLNPVSDGFQGAMVTGSQNIDGIWYQFMSEEKKEIPLGALIRN